MSNVTFPNGTTLVSDALTPDTFVNLMQPIIAGCLGFDPVANPTVAFNTVRIGWIPTGQPAWKITEDVCIIRATAVDDEYSRVRDNIYSQNTDISLDNQMGFTQVWNLHCSIYGPNAYDNARIILSALSLDWTHDTLAASNLYAVVKFDRPKYIPELFQGQWWKRADLDIRFNEGVNESIIVPAVAGGLVTILTDTGISDTFQVGPTS